MVSEAVLKSATLIESLPYIKKFRDKIIVVKLGGSAQDDPEVLTRVFADIDFMITVGMKPVVVHGGGKRISAAMATSGKEAEFVYGQRVTDRETMEIVSRVLIDEVGHELMQLMQDAGGQAGLLNGRDHAFLRAVKKHLPSHPEVDLQCVGT
ncbi:MAG: amino acid kinase family protein, partial [Planctomycetota bacterium]